MGGAGDKSAEQAYHAIMAWSASVVVHLAMALTGAALAAGVDRSAPARSFLARDTRRSGGVELVIDLPALGRSSDAWEQAARKIESDPAMGGEAMPRPDTGRAGRGGDTVSDQPAINLAARDDEAHMTPLLRSRLERAQHARKRHGHSRRSPEDDTVNDQPMILTLYIEDDGRRAEQRPPHERDPGAGSYAGARALRRGGALARHFAAGEGLIPAYGALSDGNADADALAAGTLDGAPAEDPQAAASGARSRPMGLRGMDASSADERGEHADDVDAEQEVQNDEPELLHASTAGGPSGAGVGGEAGQGPTGSGGERGRGSRARALGTGRGKGVAIDPADARRRMYRRQVWLKVQRGWSASDFPLSAALDGKQGYTIVAFTIRKDGTVSGIRTVRSSGFPSFDAKMRAAVRRVAPFGPLPKGFGSSLTVTHEFIVSNAAVR